MTKKNFMPAIVLTAICVVVAALLALVNYITAPIIAEADFAATKASLKEVMPDGDFDPEPDALRDDAPETVRYVYTDKNGGGAVAVIVTTKGYTGKEIGITVGIDNDGKLTGLKITKNEESIVPSDMKPGGSYGDAYKGESAETVPELETGATVKYSESAIKGAVMDALTYLGYAEGGSADKEDELPKTDDEIKALAKELDSELGELELLEADELSEFVKRLYRDKGGKGFFAYIVTSTEWNPLETEIGVAFDASGKVSATKLLAWNLSPNYEHNNIPGDGFVSGFVGKDTAGVEGVELVTHITQTTTRVRDAIASASKAVSLPTSEEEISNIVNELLSKNVSLEPITPDGVNEFVKKSYALSDGSGYAAYIITYTEWNKHECEAVVTFNNDGKVTGVKLLAWNLSPNYEYNNIKGDDFAASLVGKDESTLPSVELITHVTQTSARLRDTVISFSKAVALPTSESDIASIAGELIGKSVTLENATPDGINDMVKRLYRTSDGNAYIAYIITYTEWNKHEAELVVAYDRAGTVTGVKLLAWNLSPTYEHKDISGDSFASSLVGKNDSTLPSVELVTHVTQTSTRVRDAVLAVSKALSLPTPESEIIAIGSAFLTSGESYSDITPTEVPLGVKRIYKNALGEYIAYIVTFTEWNPKETEIVVAIDKYGTVKGTKLLTWQLSPTYEHNDIKGDGFVASLVGKDSEGVEKIELVTHVTQTTTRVRDALSGAMSLMSFSEAPVSNAPRIIGLAVLALAILLPIAYCIIKRRMRG